MFIAKSDKTTELNFFSIITKEKRDKIKTIKNENLIKIIKEAVVNI
jgi:hypothetical protein